MISDECPDSHCVKSIFLLNYKCIIIGKWYINNIRGKAYNSEKNQGNNNNMEPKINPKNIIIGRDSRPSGEFIENIVLEGKDCMKPKRAEFVNNTLLPPNNKTASENIYEEILKVLS